MFYVFQNWDDTSATKQVHHAVQQHLTKFELQDFYVKNLLFSKERIFISPGLKSPVHLEAFQTTVSITAITFDATVDDNLRLRLKGLNESGNVPLII
jgi:hypothetical protein